jgi:5-methyltetrahydropteroyltriglutamate--homocysteine methyltransferase
MANPRGKPRQNRPVGAKSPGPVCVGPITYTGHHAIATDIANFRAAMQASRVDEGFMSSVAPGSASRIANLPKAHCR